MENLENIISKLDKSSAESDFEIKNLQSNFLSTKGELSDSLKSFLNHELNIFKSDQSNFKDEANDLLVKNKKEINQLRGQVASLVDEKCNLIKRITVLEEDSIAKNSNG